MTRIARGALLGAAVLAAACNGTPAEPTPDGGGGGPNSDLEALDQPASPPPRPTPTPTPVATATPTLAPTATPTPIAVVDIPTPTPEPSDTPTPVPTPKPTATPDSNASDAASPSPSPSPTKSPSPSPSPSPTATPTPAATANQDCSDATPAPGGGPICFPPGTKFVTGTVKIKLGADGFAPDHVYVKPNTTTTWTNTDTKPHSVAGVDLGSFNSGAIAPGASYSHTWKNAGAWSIHDNQAGGTPPEMQTVVNP